MTDSPSGLRYERDPHEIYRQSFATVRAEARLDHLPEDLHEVALFSFEQRIEAQYEITTQKGLLNCRGLNES